MVLSVKAWESLGSFEAIAKAVEDAKKNLVRISIAKGTLPHGKREIWRSQSVFKPASEGTGVIAGGAVRAVLGQLGFTMYYQNHKVHLMRIML